MPFEQVRPADKIVTLLTTANTAGTLTLPAVAHSRHYITHIEITRINSSATAISPTGIINFTTTNLNGLAYSMANALGAGQTNEVIRDYATPVKSQNAGVASTISIPAGGAGVQYRVNVFYYLGE